jgi:hypothetical protein
MLKFTAVANSFDENAIRDGHSVTPEARDSQNINNWKTGVLIDNALTLEAYTLLETLAARLKDRCASLNNS